MKRIFDIIIHDFRKITSSVVAIVIILGLCIVPCLYAWFNILSNWDPYSPDSTGNIKVAVVSEDKGTELLGLNINVGEKIVTGLEANDSIGWTFLDDKKEALEGVRAGDYYAAAVIPADFSADALSMITDDLQHPEIVYYENEKKNAVAVKITDKAKSALQKSINTTVIETAARYVTEAAQVSKATGADPASLFSGLGETMSQLSEKLDYGTAIADAATGLTGAAGSLLAVSDDLIGSTGDTLSEGEKLLDSADESLPKISSSGSSVAETVREEARILSADTKTLRQDLSAAAEDMKAFNEFVDKDLSARIKLVNEMKSSARRISENLSKLGLTKLAGLFSDIEKKLGKVADKLGKLEKANSAAWEGSRAELGSIRQDLAYVKKKIRSVLDNTKGDLDSKIRKAVSDVKAVVSDTRKTLNDSYEGLDALSGTLAGYESSLDGLEERINETAAVLGSMKRGLNALSSIFTRLSESDAVKNINHLISDGSDVIAEHLASPVRMEHKDLYPIENNGSAMAPFYTVLAQWVGALLAAVLISAGIKKRRQLQGLRLHERFFGRYRLFLMVGLVQALIVSLGDLLYIGIQCHDPVRFVLAACVNGAVFSMINYALVFALEKAGLAVGVVILILQVAGSGGTFPVEVLPEPFGSIYPFLPFRYAMDAMRECVAGSYGNTYVTCMGVLGLFFAGAVAFGLLMYYPALKLNRKISESMRKSDIML